MPKNKKPYFTRLFRVFENIIFPKNGKIMFFGKTEDEVRRYVMALNHVSGVEMKFHPAWNREVPHVASRVEVTIRQVQ